jgi:hypothetical protein
MELNWLGGNELKSEQIKSNYITLHYIKLVWMSSNTLKSFPFAIIRVNSSHVHCFHSIINHFDSNRRDSNQFDQIRLNLTEFNGIRLSSTQSKLYQLSSIRFYTNWFISNRVSPNSLPSHQCKTIGMMRQHGQESKQEHSSDQNRTG